MYMFSHSVALHAMLTVDRRSFTNLVPVFLKQLVDYHRTTQWLSSYHPLFSYWL